jgi:hypothetical protein
MRLSEFKEQGKGSERWLATTVKDSSGQSTHRLELLGHAAMLRRAFGESNFSVTLNHSRQQRDWEEAVSRVFEGQVPNMGDTRNIADFMKPQTPKASRQKSAFVVLRPTVPSKTFYILSVAFVIPTGWNFFFVLAPCCSVFAVVMPVTGDQDLFLSLNGAFTPVVAASTLGGLAWDRVSFSGACWPWTQFVPFFRVRGFIGGACSFTWGGFGVP